MNKIKNRKMSCTALCVLFLCFVALLWAVTGCGTLTQPAEQTIARPVETPFGWETNFISVPGVAPAPALGTVQSLGDSGLLGPYGDLGASALAIGIAAYVRYRNKRELAQHIAGESKSPPVA